MAITKAAFSTGLGRLAVAARQTLDVPTLTVYHEAMGEEVEPESWDSFTRRAAAEGEFKDWNGVCCIPKLHELREAYARSKVLPFQRPPIRDPWTTEDDFDPYLQAVRADPYVWPTNPLRYIVRIAETVEKQRMPIKTMGATRERVPGEEG